MKKHGDFLWALGGEIIRDTSESGFDQNRPDYDLVLGYVDNLGGPYWRHASSNTTEFAAHFIGSCTIPSRTDNFDQYLPTNFAEAPNFIRSLCVDKKNSWSYTYLMLTKLRSSWR